MDPEADNRSPQSAESPPEPDALFRDLEARIEWADRSPLWRARSLPTGLRWGIAWGGIALTALVVFVVSRRADWGIYPAGRMTLELGVLAGAAGLTVVLGLRPLQRLAPRAGWGIAVALLLTALVFVHAALPPAHTTLDVSTPRTPLWSHALPCLLYGLAVGLPILVVIRIFDRGSVHAPWMAAAAGGLTGHLALQLHCPITLSAHNLAGHATVAAVLVAATVVERATRRIRP